jgi:nanoRNase/pAp phosphatase (c-di-AMP/oligoRNAs hydrolase)
MIFLDMITDTFEFMRITESHYTAVYENKHKAEIRRKHAYIRDNKRTEETKPRSIAEA